MKNTDDDTTYTGKTDDLQRRIKEHYADPGRHFHKVTFDETDTAEKASALEKRRLETRMPPENKRKG